MNLPNSWQYILGTSLYSKVTFEEKDVWAVLDLIYPVGNYDSYCPECCRDSTFQIVKQERPSSFIRNVQKEKLLRLNGSMPEIPNIAGAYHTQALCSRNTKHIQQFFSLVEYELIKDKNEKNNIQITLQKIGQYPSYGDLHSSKIKKYIHVLERTQYGELSRAIGLASHDVGVGAYVYLRRIFEKLVEDARDVASTESSWNEDLYQRSRMNDRISLLKAQLPSFLVEHPQMYSLLSKGIHELSEDDCLKHFETLRIGIELILDERIEQREKKKKILAAKSAISKAIGDTNA